MNLLSAIFLSALLSAIPCMAKAMINMLPEDSFVLRIAKIDPQSEGPGEDFLHEVPVQSVDYRPLSDSEWRYNFEGRKDFAQPTDVRSAEIEWGHEVSECLLYGEDGAELTYTHMSEHVAFIEDLTGIHGAVCRSFVEEEVEEEEGEGEDEEG